MKHARMMAGGTATSLLLAVVLLAPITGCQTTPEPVDTSGPPPVGYATWDDYWKAKDRAYRDFERDVQMQEMKRQRTPGTPR